MSLLESLSPDQKQKVQELRESIKSKQVLTEINKLMFNDSHYARFLVSTDFDIEKAVKKFVNYINWRQQYGTDLLLDADLIEESDVRQDYPYGFHQADKKGRPIQVHRLGSLKANDLFDNVDADKILKVFVRDLEIAWRELMPAAGKKADQIFVLVDLKGIKLKDLSSKNIKGFFNSYLKIVQDNYPELLYRVFVLNSPMLFQNIWDELKSDLSERTAAKVTITGGRNEAELETLIDKDILGEIFNEQCEFDDHINDEEVKSDGDDDYRNQFEGLKSAISKNIPSMGPSMIKNKFAGNDLSSLKNMDFELPNPNATPMNTQIDEDH